MFIMATKTIDLPTNLAQSMHTKNKVKLTKMYDKLRRLKKEIGTIPKEDFEWKNSFTEEERKKYDAAWDILFKKDVLVANIANTVEFQKALKTYIRKGL